MLAAVLPKSPASSVPLGAGRRSPREPAFELGVHELLQRLLQRRRFTRFEPEVGSDRGPDRAVRAEKPGAEDRAPRRAEVRALPAARTAPLTQTASAQTPQSQPTAALLAMPTTPATPSTQNTRRRHARRRRERG